MLCPRCGALCDSVDPHRDNDFVHHGTTKALHTSAVSGCRLCKIVYTELERLNVSIDGSTSLTVQIKRDMGIEVTATEATPASAEPLVFYVVFQAFKLPRRYCSKAELS